MFYLQHSAWTWILAAWSDWQTFRDAAMTLTGVKGFVLAGIGVAFTAQVFRMVFGRGGSAVNDAMGTYAPLAPGRSDAEWAHLEQRARRVNGWKG